MEHGAAVGLSFVVDAKPGDSPRIPDRDGYLVLVAEKPKQSAWAGSVLMKDNWGIMSRE